MPWRKYLSALYLKWPFWILVCALWLRIFWLAYDRGSLRWGIVSRETGQLALWLLALTLLLGLLRKLFPACAALVRILPLRKHSGVLAFLIAGCHGIAEWAKNGIHTDWSAAFSYSLLADWRITLGSASFLLMLPLFATSTHWAVKAMGAKAWFWLHKLAHPAFILAALHAALGGASLRMKPLIALGIYAAAYSFLLARKLFKSSHKPGGADASAFV